MSARTSFAVMTTAFLMMTGAWAAVPQSMSYQGYLTDRIGSPIMESQTITFSIYTVPVSGVPVWQETKSVAFNNGLFSTRLGEVSAFPLDLFDVPLWLGMTIGTDSEMEPRRQLTTAGFSFRSEDADALQGRTAFELDQSLHVDDLSNPHEVSAGEIGAATQGQLAVHTTNTGNPHSVSVGQTGGISAATFGTHAAEPAAHHNRYADAETLAAMGTEQDTNPLNHGRYADTEAVSAVIAADGDGSGLDADLVDGLQATEIINAAAGAVGGPRYEFVGFSTDTVAADQGLLGMSTACQATFGASAKFSTSKEILETASFTLQTGEAWAQPIIVGSLSGSMLGISGMIGTTGPASLSCAGWTEGFSNSGVYGLVVTSNIGFIRERCDSANHAACSLPIGN